MPITSSLMHEKVDKRQIEYRSDKSDNRTDNNDSPDDMVNDTDTLNIKFITDLIHHPRQSIPPQVSAKDNA